MARAQRRKGIRGELEVAAILRAHGFAARRDGRLDEDLAHDVAGYHFEVRRRETLALPAWTRDAEQGAAGRVPVVAYRRSGEPWYAVLPFEELARLLAIERGVGDCAPDDRPGRRSARGCLRRRFGGGSIAASSRSSAAAGSCGSGRTTFAATCRSGRHGPAPGSGSVRPMGSSRRGSSGRPSPEKCKEA